jgi:hypothetical protein
VQGSGFRVMLHLVDFARAAIVIRHLYARVALRRSAHPGRRPLWSQGGAEDETPEGRLVQNPRPLGLMVIGLFQARAGEGQGYRQRLSDQKRQGANGDSAGAGQKKTTN